MLIVQIWGFGIKATGQASLIMLEDYLRDEQAKDMPAMWAATAAAN